MPVNLGPGKSGKGQLFGARGLGKSGAQFIGGPVNPGAMVNGIVKCTDLHLNLYLGKEKGPANRASYSLI